MFEAVCVSWAANVGNYTCIVLYQCYNITNQIALNSSVVQQLFNFHVFYMDYKLVMMLQYNILARYYISLKLLLHILSFMLDDVETCGTYC